MDARDDLLREMILGDDLYFSLLFGEGADDHELRERAKTLGLVNEKELASICRLRSEKTGGLKIGSQYITRLSGPCSFRLFTPKYKYLPVIMCLGDLHQTITGMCESCVCHDLEDCCYKSFDPVFLKQLDTLSTSEQPLDLYIETFSTTKLSSREIAELQQKHIEGEQRIDEPLYMLKLNYLSCMPRTPRTPTKADRKDTQCPTSRIRWHFSDPRVNIQKRLDTTGLVFENALMDFVGLARHTHFNLSRLELFYTKRPHYLTELQGILLLVFTDLDAYLYTWLSYDSSKVAKQFHKLSPSLQVHLRPLLLQYLVFVRESVIRLYPEEIQTRLVSFLKRESSTAVTSPLLLERMFHLLVQMVSPCLDIYAYLRCIKVTPRAWCCVMVMGEQHCRGMSHFLTSILNQYTEQVSISGVSFKETTIQHHDLSAQCIDLSSHFIDLNGLRQFYTGNEDYEWTRSEELYDTFTQTQARMLYNLRRILFGFTYNDTVNSLRCNKEEYVTHIKLRLARYSKNTDTILRLCHFDLFEQEVKWVHQLGSQKSKWNRKVQKELEESLRRLQPTCFIIEAVLSSPKFDTTFQNKIIGWITSLVKPTIDCCNKILLDKRSRLMVIRLLMDPAFHLIPNVFTFDHLLEGFKHTKEEVELFKRCLLDYKLEGNLVALQRIARESEELRPIIEETEETEETKVSA